MINASLRFVFSPLATAYQAASLLRLYAYRSGFFRRYKAPIPVISVGNLTVGGTGKTPITIDIAQRLIEAGYKPAILSRGYKRQSAADYVIVSDGQKILVPCQDAGDEPYLIARSVAKAVVIVGAERAKTAQIASSQYGCNIIVLDDGFQHLQIVRDLDIVLIDYNDDLEKLRVLPTGRLREPLGALARASCVVITKVPESPSHEKLEKISQAIHKSNSQVSISFVRFSPETFVSFDNCDQINKSDQSDQSDQSVKSDQNTPQDFKQAIAFCGLARPEGFFKALAAKNIVPLGKIAFADHHWYTTSDTRKLNALARKSHAQSFLTTEKDLVKLSHLQSELERPVFALQLTTHWIGALPQALCEFLEANIKK